MNTSLRTQIDAYLIQLESLILRGNGLRDRLAAQASDLSAIHDTRQWQEDCGVTINQLSGGSKAHWLARSFSQAFLMRAEDGRAIEGVEPAEIVRRLLDVLQLAVVTLSQSDEAPMVAASSQAPAPHRFDFVHNIELRPVLEQAFADASRAFEKQDYDAAMRTSCGILEAIVTDALEHKGLSALMVSGAPAEKISEWSFETRLAVAERAGLIRGGCARLPAVARGYRDRGEVPAGTQVSEREARLCAQVLRVIMRDLDPGR
ncbi:MAG: hypothetical protein ABSF59_13760 [Candidatus Sulfotelmatobacter sp.]|jgi:hypothetical protein